MIFLAVAWMPVAGVAADAPTSPSAAQESRSTPTTQTLTRVPVDFAAETFVNKCTGCHTIGGGKLTGPDLITVTTWRRPELTKKIKEMEKNVGPLTDKEIGSLADLLKDPHVRRRVAAEESRVTALAEAQLAPPSPAKGRALFEGEAAFVNGGTACIACHRVAGRGGSLGPDLTFVFNRMGRAGLISACQNTNFKVMRAVYRAHPITRQEALHLMAFFRSAAIRTESAKTGSGGAPISGGNVSGTPGLSTGTMAKATSPVLSAATGRQVAPPSTAPPVGGIGVVLAVVTLAGIGLGYRKRNPGVRARLVREAHRR